jgi:hypothetical protein
MCLNLSKNHTNKNLMCETKVTKQPISNEIRIMVIIQKKINSKKENT